MLTQSASYSFSSYLRIICKLVMGLFVARILDPVLYGIKNVFDLIIDYQVYSGFGISAGMNRQVPYFRGKDDKKTIEKIYSSVFSVNLIYGLCIGFGLVVLSFYLRSIHVQKVYVDCIILLGLLTITSKIQEFYVNKLKCEKKFLLISKSEMLFGVVALILCVVLVYFFSVQGFFTGLLASQLIWLLYILAKERYVPEIHIDWKLVWELLKIGFPIMIAGVLFMLLRSADRIIIISFLTKEALGYFALATVATTIVGIIPMAIYSVTLPRLVEKYGRTNDVKRIRHYLIDPTIVIAYGLPFLLACIYFGVHLPIDYFLTKYQPSVMVTKILSCGLFFAAFTMPMSICYTLNRQWNVIAIAAPVVLFNFILNYSFVRWGAGINGVALGTGISYFAYTTAIIWYAFVLLNTRTIEILKFIFLIYAPFCYSVALFLLLDAVISPKRGNVITDVAITLLQLAIFCALYSVVFIFIRKQQIMTKLADNFPISQNVVRWFSKKKYIATS